MFTPHSITDLKPAAEGSGVGRLIFLAHRNLVLRERGIVTREQLLLSWSASNSSRAKMEANQVN